MGVTHRQDSDGNAAAQVHIYLPDAGHPAHGLVRVIAKDSTDNFTGPTTRTWLDSGAQAPSHQCSIRSLRQMVYKMSPEGMPNAETFRHGNPGMQCWSKEGQPSCKHRT